MGHTIACTHTQTQTEVGEGGREKEIERFYKKKKAGSILCQLHKNLYPELKVNWLSSSSIWKIIDIILAEQ